MALSLGADPGFVGPEAYSIWRALFKKKNTKLQIPTYNQKLIFIQKGACACVRGPKS